MTERFDNDFYVYLLSNANPNMYPDNTPSNFRNELHMPIQLGNETDLWEVGVTELQIPTHFYNITEGNNKFSIRRSTQKRKKRSLGIEVKEKKSKKGERWEEPTTISLAAGTFLSFENFISLIEDQLKKHDPTLTFKYREFTGPKKIKEIFINDAPGTKYRLGEVDDKGLPVEEHVVPYDGNLMINVSDTVSSGVFLSPEVFFVRRFKENPDWREEDEVPFETLDDFELNQFYERQRQNMIKSKNFLKNERK